jgi:hypothetical protein
VTVANRLEPETGMVSGELPAGNRPKPINLTHLTESQRRDVLLALSQMGTAMR